MNTTPHDIPPTLKCSGCGYDLRGSSRDGDCPECGLATQRSLQKAAQWRRTVIYWSVSCVVGSIMLCLVGLNVFHESGAFGFAASEWSQRFQVIWGIVALLSGIAMISFGILLLFTRREGMLHALFVSWIVFDISVFFIIANYIAEVFFTLSYA